MPTDDPTTPAASKQIVAARIPLGVIHEKAWLEAGSCAARGGIPGEGPTGDPARGAEQPYL